MGLSEQEEERYLRHLPLEEIGLGGQEKLKQSAVLVVGAGGLGSPVLLYLAAAGVGRLGIVDDDRVAVSNLQRQVLYDTPSVDLPKVDVARRRLEGLNPLCRVTTHECRLTGENADEIIAPYHVVVDATDNLATRYLMDDACERLRKPLVHASVRGWNGQLSVFHYRGGPAYRDLYPYHEGIHHFRQPLGLMGVLPGVVGLLQATEVIKIIAGLEGVLSGKLLLVDLLAPRFTTVNLKKPANDKE
ncbi:MAG: HesA/MoeB/ThiF family protein [Odoribacteraceae bacterium]|jgi:adenylyltransferase/sulfurtransferase|nr:HesA/MoeB/ThiF family protein [Odoribacteraceae bacterium]